jgi:hypothetical protein
MSMMPFDIVGPILQAPSAARNAASVTDAARNRQVGTVNDQAKLRDVTENSIGTTDGDTEVNPDTMGAGGQGRAFRDGGEDAGREATAEGGVTTDVEGQYHLDIEV